MLIVSNTEAYDFPLLFLPRNHGNFVSLMVRRISPSANLPYRLWFLFSRPFSIIILTRKLKIYLNCVQLLFSKQEKFESNTRNMKIELDELENYSI